MYIQRYLPHLPAAGEIVIFDRSWYNRAGVERVMGFCTRGAGRSVPEIVPGVEKAIVESGVILLNTGSRSARRNRRAASRRASRICARSGSCRRWTSNPTAAGTTIHAPATTCSPPPTPHGLPGSPSDSDDKRRARLNIITHLLGKIPYEEIPRQKVKLPKRQKPHDYREPDFAKHWVSEA